MSGARRNGRSRRQGLKAHARSSPDHAVSRASDQHSRADVPRARRPSVSISLRLVVLGDSLIKAGRPAVLRLTEFLVDTSASGRVGCRNAVRYVRENVDSPMEAGCGCSWSLAGLPEPTINLILRNADGSWRRRFDMCFPDLKMIIEYDGRQHAGRHPPVAGRSRRREELDALGWRIIVVTADDLVPSARRTCSIAYASHDSIGARPGSVAGSRTTGVDTSPDAPRGCETTNPAPRIRPFRTRGCETHAQPESGGYGWGQYSSSGNSPVTT